MATEAHGKISRTNPLQTILPVAEGMALHVEESRYTWISLWRMNSRLPLSRVAVISLMRIIYISCLLLALLAGLSLPVFAAEWSIEPRISARSGYNDNIRLTTADHDSVWETTLTPAVKFGVSKETQGLFGNASASIHRFYGGSGENSSSRLNREDYHLNVDSYQRTERNDFGANLNITHDSTLQTELDQTGQVITDRATRLSIALGPSWTRTLDEKTQVNLGYQFNRVDYSNEIGANNLINYDYNTASASLTRIFTQLTQGTISTSFSRYEPETGLNSDTYAIRAGITRKHSETLSTSWLAGWRQTNSDTLIPTGFCVGANPGAGFPKCTGGIPVQTGTDTDEVNNTGATYSVRVTKLLEKGSLEASLTRIATPSGDGQLLDTTKLNFTGEHRFTETLRSNLTASYYKRETIANASGGKPNSGDKFFFRITPSITWQWQREWLLAGEYRYSESENTNGDTATQNAVYLTLTYRPTKIFTSR